MAEERPVVLVVEDERNLADLYTRWLEEAFMVRTAYDGEQALELMDDDVDVVLLDRRMPGLSGDEFLDRIREAGYDCRVAMVTAVDPDFDVLELGFDDYVTKPVDQSQLLKLVEELLEVGSAGADVQAYRSMKEKRAAIEAEKNRDELGGNRDYAELLADLDAFETRVMSLAEAAFDRGGGGVDPAFAETYREAIETWEGRKSAAGDGDPLSQVAEEMIQKYRDMIDSGDPGAAEARREFLEIVADGFVAEGFWLDSRILRALNSLLFGKYGDSLVVERHVLREGIDLEPGVIYETSDAIRELARQKLAEMGAA